MSDDHKDKDDTLTERILAIGTVTLVTIITLCLLVKEIPAKNEVLLGTLVGFIFGNMAGPVYRKIFGGADTSTQKAQTQAATALQTAVDKIAPSVVPPSDSTTVIRVDPPATVTVDPAGGLNAQPDPDRSADAPQDDRKV